MSNSQKVEKEKKKKTKKRKWWDNSQSGFLGNLLCVSIYGVLPEIRFFLSLSRLFFYFFNGALLLRGW